MEEEKRPSAALVNSEWYKAAKGVLNRAQMGELLIAAVDFVLIGETEPIKDAAVSMCFAMVKPALVSDVEKYKERCARNAANARSRVERVAASGSESQRVGANTTTTTTTTSTTTSTINSSISTEEREREEKFIVFGYFWSLGSSNVVEECSQFWSYYEALGWKNNKGAVIESKLAAARMWRRKFECTESKAGAREWYQALKSVAIQDYQIWYAYAGAEVVDNVLHVRLRVTEAWLNTFIENCAPHLDKFRRLCGAAGIQMERIG